MRHYGVGGMTRGSKRQKGNGWELRYKGHSRTVKAAGARRAGDLLREFCDEVDAGQTPVTDLTVAELVDRWIDQRSDDLTPYTLRGYRGSYKRYIEPEFRTTKVHRLKAAHLTDFYRKLRTQGLAPATIRQTHSVLRKAFADACDEELISDNPAVRAKLPKQRKYEYDAPDVDGVLRLFAVADAYSPEWGTAVRLTAATGIRRGELCGLHWSKVDLKAGTLQIARSLSDADGVLFEKVTKTERVRSFVLDPKTAERMREHRALVEERAAFAEGTLEPDGYVFSNDAAGTNPWVPQRVTETFRRMARKAGVSSRIHDLRHFHGAELIALGFDVRTVAERLGHASPVTTLNIYSHAVKGRDEAVAAAMGTLLDDRDTEESAL